MHDSIDTPITNSPYGRWESSLTPESVVAGQGNVAFPLPTDDGIFFLETLPEEGNRFVLFSLVNGEDKQRVSPPTFNLRSQVHEYGGLPYAVSDDSVFWCNFADQCVYRQDRQRVEEPEYAGNSQWSEPIALTSGDQKLRFVDFCYDAKRERLIAVCEDHSQKGGVEQNDQPSNSVVAINCSGSSSSIETLFSGTDFVAAPHLSPQGNALAFISWQHPSMPWDETTLNLLTLNSDGSPGQHQQFTMDTPASILQPQFGPNGDLYLLGDWSDWWNLYRIPAKALVELAKAKAEPVLPIEQECCSSPWQLGHASYTLLDDDSVLFCSTQNCQWRLLHLVRGEIKPRCLMRGQGGIEQLRSNDNQISFLAATAQQGISVYHLNSESQPEKVYTPSGGADLDTEAVAVPEHISFPVITAGASTEEVAHGLYYTPCNPGFSAPGGTSPPLIVMVHGGPTSTARAVFSPGLQFWTSRGFAVLDLNHRGSTGYGRQFRRRLYGQWGVVDIEDIVAGVRHLIELGRVDQKAIFIRGGSAGGYAVLAALCSSDLFAGGACFYGVSDLETLAADTHKFESRYLDQLIGPYPQAKDVYIERSPIHRVEEISVPVLLLQGGQDKVVPPAQAETIASKLKQQNPGSRYLLFPNEGHGFRAPENQITALTAELDFYQALLL